MDFSDLSDFSLFKVQIINDELLRNMLVYNC